MTDYRRFLASATTAERRVLPYFGGPYVTADRLLRVTAPVEPGFWRFELSGRRARPVEVAEPPDLSDLPAVRGYALAGHRDGYLVGAGGRAELLAIAPADEPLPFAPLVARRWPGGELLPDMVDFETGVEDEVRDAYERGRSLHGVRGVPAALRACFGYAVAFRAAVERDIPVRAAEVYPHVREIAEEGGPAARRVLDALAARRAERDRRHRPAPGRSGADRPAPERARGPAEPGHDRSRPEPEERVAAALRAAGAALRGTRRLSGGLLEARYDFDGERFVTLVDAETLGVVDSGICLDGTDDQLTLESLPSAIREAIRTDQLYVTRH